MVKNQEEVAAHITNFYSSLYNQKRIQQNDHNVNEFLKEMPELDQPGRIKALKRISKTDLENSPALDENFGYGPRFL